MATGLHEKTVDFDIKELELRGLRALGNTVCVSEHLFVFFLLQEEVKMSLSKWLFWELFDVRQVKSAACP